MAARTHKIKLDERWKEKIRVGMLINHLRNHVLGICKMEPSQVRAAEILLKKVVPDLSSVEMNANVEHRYAARLPATQQKADAWQQQHSPEQEPQTIQ